MVYTAIEPTAEELQAYYGNYPAVEQLTAVTRKRFNELLDRFEAYRMTGRLIDVGCGAGLFLRVAAERGWEVHGTEYGSKPIKACRENGIDVLEGALDPANYPPESFDVVCSFEVMEHLAHPAAEVERMAALLRPGGLLYATTPNFDCLARRVAPADWNVVNYPEHLTYFTPKTLARLIVARGFKKVWLITTGFSMYRWRTGRTKLSKEDKQRSRVAQEQFREQLEGRVLLRWAKAGVNAVLDFLRLGDSLKGGFRKHGGEA